MLFFFSMFVFAEVLVCSDEISQQELRLFLLCDDIIHLNFP